MIPKIKFIHDPYASELFMARRDHALVTGQPMVERPYFFQNEETGQYFYDLYGCIGWPTEVNEKEEGRPGYAAIMGIVKPSADEKDYDVSQAKFQLLAEYQSNDVPELLSGCLKLREEYGFGIQPSLLRVWYGDPERFLTVLALRNELLVKQGGERAAILVTPPDDFYTDKIFDNYVRAIRSAIIAKRLYFGGCEILKNTLLEFTRDAPAIMAVGGLIHSLVCRCQWMDQIENNIFNVGDVA
jgi:hypothetical protein